ncbi:hypothetical protein A616_16905 [Brevibacillus brevis X23]|nr:hypothetical protein A616_16905 [Brevibacillus brevis X23]
MINKESKIRSKITGLRIELTKILTKIELANQKRTPFGNERINAHVQNLKAQSRNIIKAIEFNERKLEKPQVQSK